MRRIDRHLRRHRLLDGTDPDAVHEDTEDKLAASAVSGQVPPVGFPSYRLRLVSGVEAHNHYVRFSWAAGGAPEAPLYLGGTDFGVIGSDGRFQSVTSFTDAAPAPLTRG